MFGNFNLNAGLSQLQDLGGRFQKIREDLEQNIESSLRTNIAPAAGSSLDQDTNTLTPSADGTVAFGGTVAVLCKQIMLLHQFSPSFQRRYRPCMAGEALQFFFPIHVWDICRFVGRLQLGCNSCQGEVLCCAAHVAPASFANTLTLIAQSRMCKQQITAMIHMLSPAA